MEYENGKTYLIDHSRKGRFIIKINRQCETWLHGIITDGRAGAILDYNEGLVGDEITIRKSHISNFVLQP